MMLPSCTQRNGRVVIEARRAALKQRCHNDNTSLAGNFGESVCRGPGNRLSKIEELDVFALAKVLSAKKLRQADDLRAALGRFANMRNGGLEICVGVGAHPHLHQADFVFAGVFHFE